MRAAVVWADRVHDKNNIKQVIYALTFAPNGNQLIAGAGNRVLVYRTGDGDLLTSLRGHKGTVYCLAYQSDGKRFASGAADKRVIIWTEDLNAILNYSHTDAIQCLAFNPINHTLASCTISDFGFWSADAKAVNKIPVRSRVCCASWTNDGNYLALGLANGTVTIRNKAGEVVGRPINRAGGAVWALAWNPSKKADLPDILAVCDWNKKLSFYVLSGRQVGKDKMLDYDPCCLNYFSTGDFLVIGGSDRKASLYTREGVRLHTICEQEGWVWSCAVRPNQNYVAVGCQDGTIALYQLIFSTVHGLYKDRYAFRKQMTDVMIQDLTTKSETRIKCRDLVKKIAIYKDRMAVQLPNAINVYDVFTTETGETKAHINTKIKEKFDCNLLVVCSRNIILCQEKRLQCLSFDGTKEREWTMEALIRYIKVTGGPGGREPGEGLLVGLKNGLILKIFVENPFPIELIKQKTAVRCLDLSASRKKLAVVDENNTCIVYDLDTKEQLFAEPHANSVAWNTQNEGMLCFSGNGMLHIKAGDFPIHQQKLQGFVVGFQGSHIYCLHVYAMTGVEVPQSHSMYQYLKEKRFEEAYRVACLGVTDADWEALGLDALEGLELGIAKNCFIRVRNLRYLELIHGIQQRKNSPEYVDDDEYLADIYAYQGKFAAAADLYVKVGKSNKALLMYTDLRMFDKAKLYMEPGDTKTSLMMLQKQSEWSKTAKDPSVMIDILLHAGQEDQAIDMMGENGLHARLIETARETDMGDTAKLQRIAEWLGKLAQVPLAAEIFQRISDEHGLVNLYVSNKKWQEAFALAERSPDLAEAIYMPYAEMLAEEDKFEEAQDAFRKAGHADQAIKVLEVLTHNAVLESRFSDAGYYYWQLSMAALGDLQSVAEGETSINDAKRQINKFQTKSDLYYSFDSIQRYIAEPFTSHQPDSLFNIARFLLNGIADSVPLGISKVSVLYSLAKQSRNLGAFKLARIAYETLGRLRVPSTFREQIDLGAISIMSKPRTDTEDVLPLCYRCSELNPLFEEGLDADGQKPRRGMSCVKCRQGFVYSYHSFEVLPLVEFDVDLDITDEEAMDLIEDDTGGKGSEDWQETGEDSQVMSMGDDAGGDPFTAQFMRFEDESGAFLPITANRAILRQMRSSEIYVQQWPEPIGNQYYRNVLPELSVSHCKACNKFFHSDDFELLVLQKGCCPFCRTKVSISGDPVEEVEVEPE